MTKVHVYNRTLFGALFYEGEATLLRVMNKDVDGRYYGVVKFNNGEIANRWFEKNAQLCDDCDENEATMPIEDPWGGIHGHICDVCNAERAERATELGG